MCVVIGPSFQQSLLSSNTTPSSGCPPAALFSAVAAKTLETIPGTTPLQDQEKNNVGTSASTSSGVEQDRAQRDAIFHLDLIEKPSPSSLQKALKYYKSTQDQAATPDLKKPLKERFVDFKELFVDFFISTPDPKVQQFYELQTLYSKAIHVCGDTLRLLIHEDEMQQSLETVWNTGKVDTHILAFYEKTILETVNKFLGNPLAEAAQSDGATASG
jgi:hypothetical protein